MSMSRMIRTLNATLVVDTVGRAVLRDSRWVNLPPGEWAFLMRISRRKWAKGASPDKDRRMAQRLRERIGTSRVELVRGRGYRLGQP